MAGTALKYRRVLLKLSGEILAGEEKFGIDPAVLSELIDSIIEVHTLGVELGVVIGGGNIFRGMKAGAHGLERATGDYMGMLGTMINALAIQDFIETRGVPARVMSALEIRSVAEPYIRRRAHRHLEKGRIVIFGCGTGSPYFTTDTAAALRAMEISADVVLKGTKVDFVYDKDPNRFPDAKPYQRITFMEALQQKLGVMDAAALSLCMENDLPIIVYNVRKKADLRRIVLGEEVGTMVTNQS